MADQDARGRSRWRAGTTAERNGSRAGRPFSITNFGYGVVGAEARTLRGERLGGRPGRAGRLADCRSSVARNASTLFTRPLEVKAGWSTMNFRKASRRAMSGHRSASDCGRRSGDRR
jgi:hypothetical protein